MNDWIKDLRSRPPDVVYGDREAVADGVIVDLAAKDQDVVWHEKPINRASRALYDVLAELASTHWTMADDDMAVRCELLALVEHARDTAGPGEPRDWLYSTDPVADLGMRPIWLQHNDVGGWTAMFPADY